ncbi:endonuclease domain-containing protein [Enemella dayhoffiae]|nr:DUF559 domain-containing protein [Enemella dayhoffiae]
MNSQTAIQELLCERGGVLLLRDAGALRGSLRWHHRRGNLVSLLPGVYTTPELADDHATRALAVTRYDPSAVVVGASAAALTGWPRLAPNTITAAVSGEARRFPGFEFVHRTVAPDWIRSVCGVPCASEVLTAVDLIPERGGELVDDVLRRHPSRGEWALEQLWRAYRDHPKRPGNQARREILTDSRDRPWSEAERAAHRLLRSSGLTGWMTNHPVTIEGMNYFLDAAFPGRMLGVEVNGFERHTQREVFEDDHWRRNALTLAGWTVLEFTWRMIQDHPESFVTTVQNALLWR